MGILNYVERFAVEDEGRSVVRVNKTDKANPVVERGTLCNIDVRRHATNFDFKLTTGEILTGCSTWASTIRYYDAAEFDLHVLKNDLHDKLHILAQLSYEVAEDPELTKLAEELYEKLVANLGIETVRRATFTSVTGWCADHDARLKALLRSL